MKEVKARSIGWSDSDLARTHRAKSIEILLDQDEDLWNHIFHRGVPICRLGDQEIFGRHFKSLSSEGQLLIRASLDLWDSTGDLPLWQCFWGLDHLALIRLIRAMCHLREIQLETIQGIMSDYLGPTS